MAIKLELSLDIIFMFFYDCVRTLEYAEKHVFESYYLNNSEILRLSVEDIFWGTLNTYTKKNNTPSAVAGGMVYGKVCWLMDYVLIQLYQLYFSKLFILIESNNNIVIAVCWRVSERAHLVKI